MTALDELQQVISRAAQTAAPSVVGIGGRWRRGSGVVLAKDRVLTNAHNVHGDEVTCVFSDGRRARGRLVGIDGDGDLAVLEVETGDAVPLTWAEPDADLQVGTPVVAVASAANGGVRTTAGLVSGVERSFRGPGGRLIAGSIEHTAPLAPGSSGSPVLDAAGRMIGLNTHRIGEGFYLALRADTALRGRVEALARGESASRPRLGIAVASAGVARQLRRSVGLPDRDGVLVRGVESESPAARAGIREGDLIVAAGGSPVADADALHEALAKAGDGSIEIAIVRGVEELKVTADLGGTATSEPA